MDTSIEKDVLSAIDNINETIQEASINVCNSLIDSYMKDAEMRIYYQSSGKVIQESKFSDWFNYSEDENIIKTILLFIPRMIVALIKILKKKWDDRIRLARIQELTQILEDLNSELFKLNQEVSVENERIFYDGADRKFYLRSKIKDFDMIMIDDIVNPKTLYDWYVFFFEKYRDAATDWNDMSIVLSIADGVSNDPMLRDLKRKTFATRKEDYESYVLDKDLEESLKAIREDHKKILQAISNAMDFVNKQYSDLAKKPNVSNNKNSAPISMTAADRLLQDMRRIRDDFQNIDNTVSDEIDECLKAIHELYVKISDKKRLEKNERERELTETIDKFRREREDLQDKVNEPV